VAGFLVAEPSTPNVTISPRIGESAALSPTVDAAIDRVLAM
jgi:hypothetical protein